MRFLFISMLMSSMIIIDIIPALDIMKQGYIIKRSNNRKSLQGRVRFPIGGKVRELRHDPV